VRDTSGRGNDGIMRFGATYDAAAKSLEFPLNPSTPSNSGNRDSIETGPILDGTTLVKGYSVSTWFRADSQGAWEQVWVLGKTGLGKHEGLWLSGSSTVSIHNDAGGGLNYYYPCSSGGNWKHVTFVRKGTTASDHDVYVDGVKVSASSTAGGTNVHAFEKDSNLILGENIDRNDYGFDGAISNFKLYDTALTAEEVKTLYDMGRCDEGHHVVNFSKTRVGIGLGDGEVSDALLNVGGVPYGAGVRPIFSAYEYDAYTFEALNSVQTDVILGNTFINHNNAYNTSTGVFTVPVTGEYHIFTCCQWRGFSSYNQGVKSGDINFVINGVGWNPTSTTRPVVTQTIRYANERKQLNGSLVIKLNKGDQLKVQCTNNLTGNVGDLSWGTGYGRFAAFLLS
jgi:hypothetical protein